MTATDDVVSLAAEGVNVTSMADSNLRVDGEVVLLVRLRPEHHLSVPEGGNDPELAFYYTRGKIRLDKVIFSRTYSR